MTIKNLSGLHPTRVVVVLAELIEQGYLTKVSMDHKQVYLATSKNDEPNLSRYETQLTLRTQDLNDMLDYGKHTTACLMVMLRHTLGDIEATACGHCSTCRASSIRLHYKKRDLDDINRWLNRRVSSISLGRNANIHPGIALLDGRLRSPLFIEFMKTRASDAALSNELMELIKSHLQTIKQQYNPCAMICLPSRTWQTRSAIAQFVADTLKIPLYLDHLQWQELPAERQGNLLNNDQRHTNVDKKMHLQQKLMVPRGTLLLFDDYIGCGATLKEAARVLQKSARLPNNLLPFIIASVKWRLGQRGMV